MKNCIIIINRRSGGSRKITFEKVEACLGDIYRYTRFTLPDDGDFDLAPYDAVAVCGGDGTLGWVLNDAYCRQMDVFYFPSGTLNDKAKAVRYSHAKTSCPSSYDTPPKGKNIVIGMLAQPASPPSEQSPFAPKKCDTGHQNPHTGHQNASSRDAHTAFSYVLAAGTFTPIGYTAKVEVKQRVGVLAYLGKVLKEYKIHRIDAAIVADGKRYEGQFTLLMFLKSPRCFGFRFNKAFDAERESGHLIAIRSPRRGGLLGDITLFFRFFRVFFMGLRKPLDGNIIFTEAQRVHVEQSRGADYCRDGELQRVSAGSYDVSFFKSKCLFSVIEKF